MKHYQIILTDVNKNELTSISIEAKNKKEAKKIGQKIFATTKIYDAVSFFCR
jgi:phenylacetate-coenzyme A ligase PaaK-like adenylate-forming protein